MKVLVTGASGMLGGEVAKRLRDAGHEVSAFQRRPAGIEGITDVCGSLTEADQVRRAVDGNDAVVHLAAKVSISGPEEEYRAINIEGTRNVVNALRAQGGGKLVNTSSPSVAHFGEAIVGLDATAPEPTRARGPYARTKAAAELVAMEADGNDGILVTTLRPHIVWGPGDTQLVERIVERGRKGTMPLLDRGMALIDTTYIDNAAEAFVAALERIEDVHGESFVITNGEPRTVRDFVVGLCDAAGVSRPRITVPGPLARVAGRVIEKAWELRPGYDEPPMTEFLAEQLSTAHWFDQRRTCERLQWKPRVSMDEGFAKLKAYYDKARD
ncbi:MULTISPECIES: NAD-dependent epimerase/dehydratase family protein [Dermabacter]|uniref:NAD-dependent epimerase/dehydratase family protein n=1 Tax=Dermabacter TaxID=36739 RepID=UPI000C76A28E|nr:MULTISPECIES: NAD-dependent epimerase/dehydratase family protein [Dermabacter]MCT1954637.1 NAD-dependent epimerase/dehydratase family protein [Dermabacter hominis]MCT2055450.1 NAD-dependent epimerase/dehydratase family protein [Dermabacter hominis]MCT2083068.1 NAD-dependent epimerase/dehydratase family protein [Dermabacter hominis]MCT2091060.1 NAD-dependent epimerase/dehydratase family protein [Dermabacter hominis]MCT2189921.1 NAD-dependent epimerase/dehydratase family protein [Dermabacter 